jgi:hypothetical protein
MRKILILAMVGSVCWAVAPMVSGCSSNPPGTDSAADKGSSGGGSSSGGSSGGGSSSGKSSSGGSSSGGSSGTSTSSSGSSGAGDAGVAPDEACYSQGSDACETCCQQHHPTGSSQWDDAYYGCLCDPTRCATQCAQTDCNDNDDAGSPQPGDPCDTCEKQFAPDDGGGACGPIIDKACNGSADCVAYSKCSDSCP